MSQVRAARTARRPPAPGTPTIVGHVHGAVTLALIDVALFAAMYTNAGDTGGSVTRHFCGTVPSQFIRRGRPARASSIMVEAGSLRRSRRRSRRESVIYMKDAVGWDRFDPDLPKYEAMRPRD